MKNIKLVNRIVYLIFLFAFLVFVFSGFIFSKVDIKTPADGKVKQTDPSALLRGHDADAGGG